MAEYFPLLERAVAGMRNASAEQRKAIYDRARDALIGQLRSMQPPVPDASIDRESAALDDAIQRVEASLLAAQEQPEAAPPPAPPSPAAPQAPPDAPATLDPASPTPPVEAASVQETAPVPSTAVSSNPLRRAARALRSAVVPPAAETDAPATAAPATGSTPPAEAVAPPPPVAPLPIIPPRPARQPRPAPVPPPVVAPPIVPQAAMPLRATPARPAAEALGRIVAERGPVAPVIRASRQPEAPAGPVVLPLPSAPRLEMPSFSDALTAAGERTNGDGPTAGAGEGSTEGARETPLRPLAPRPSTGERFNGRALILAAVGLAVVAGIAYAAWRLRDRPEALARSQAAMLAAQQADLQSAAKVSTRADSSAAGAPTAPPASTPVKEPVPAQTSAAPAVPPPAPAAPAAPTAAAPAPVPQPPAAASSDQPAQGAPPAVTQNPPTPAPVATPSTPAIPVAQRAAFLVDAPDEPAKVKTYVGTVVWTTDNASPAQNQPISRAVHADVDVPDAGIRLSMTFQKNFEAQFPASHTLELRFTLLPGNTLGPIKQINMPQMRKDDAPAGDALIGLPVTITDNYFLVGMSRGDATPVNLDLIKSRNWFDIPILLTSGKVAKITFEKGTTGQKAIDEVLQSWQ